MKPWREVAVPHPDVLKGTFQQAEFAADISAVKKGIASHGYQDAGAFFQRTFITEGMRLLLTSVAQRLNGQGGDPVIQLQTAFGGGKTHTMLAVYHLATRSCALHELVGIPSLLDQAGMLDVPQARVVVLDGNVHAPGQPWKRGRQQVHTLWGELAWQLGGAEAYARVREADTSGTSPGKDVLKALIEAYTPCIILVDELVAYIRQFPESKALSGGTYDSNLSFVQALTEALKQVPTAQLLASLPESEAEAGGPRGVAVLRALEKTFGRVQALWKPVATEEAFEIVRRRLFEPISDHAVRDQVCRAFADAYKLEGEKLPAETQDARYYERLRQAYPIHPEIFDRLYEDWSPLESFQRTRGVLKLMARVIYRLWKDENQEPMILPGSLPLADSSTRNELTYHLPAGWDPVIERDIDGERAETTELESKEPRFGQVLAARRVGRTLFLGTAPSGTVQQKGIRGLDRARILLGCVQPGHPSATFSDALNRLADRLHHLNTSGDKTQPSTRFWLDTRANLRREMEDRKRQFQQDTDLKPRIAEALKTISKGITLFDGLHIFVGHGDVPDDGALRLVFLPTDKCFSRSEPRPAVDAAHEYLKLNGTKPRLKANRLLFVAADYGMLSRLYDVVRTALAWASIVKDIGENRLVIDQLQQAQAHKELVTANEVVNRVARDAYKWLLCPVMLVATDRQPQLEEHAIPTNGGNFVQEFERLCRENELIIETWAALHLRDRLAELYWKPERVAVKATTFWEDSLRYLYLPRLRNRTVLEKAIQQGAKVTEFFATALAQVEDRFQGFKRTSLSIQLDDGLLLIEPGAAAAYEQRLKDEAEAAELAEMARKKALEDAHKQVWTPEQLPDLQGKVVQTSVQQPDAWKPSPVKEVKKPTQEQMPFARPVEFFGNIDIPAATAKKRLVEIADEVIALLAKDPKATVRINLSIDAEFPEGADEQLRRAVSENVKTLGFKDGRWE